jgi:hypothetical protein
MGVWLMLLALPVASNHRRTDQLLVFLALAALHIASSVFYWKYSLSNPADSRFYFFAPSEWLHLDVTSGTILTVQLIDSLKSSLGGSYLDYFLLFQAFSFWGIAVLLRTSNEIHAEYGILPNGLAWFPLFIPSLHFWTSAIGKDSPLFLAVSLAVWSAMRLRSRLPFMAGALLLMVLFRPHVAFVTAVSLAVAALLGGGTAPLARIGLICLSIIGMAATAVSVERSLPVELSSPSSVGAFLDQVQSREKLTDGATTISGLSYPSRLFSLLFRPFFIDANGLLGIAASIENLFVVGVVFSLISNWRLLLWLFRSSFLVRFVSVFTVIMLILLSMVYYNVGLGLRQRTMVFSTLFVLLTVLWAVRRAFASQPATVPSRVEESI